MPKTKTLGSLFLACASRDKPDCLLIRRGEIYVPLPVAEFYRRVAKLHLSLLDLGLKRGDRCALLSESRRFARERGISFASRSDLVRLPEVQALIEQHVASACTPLASFEQVKKVLLLEREFSIDGGEITPTLKVRRQEIERLY